MAALILYVMLAGISSGIIYAALEMDYFIEPCQDGTTSGLFDLFRVLSNCSKSQCSLYCLNEGADCVGFSTQPCSLYSNVSAVCVKRPAGVEAYIRRELSSSMYPLRFLHGSDQSYYAVVNTSEGLSTWPQVKAMCTSYDAHLVAVETQQEHNHIKGFMADTYPSCAKFWTSGFLSSSSATGWSWDLGASQIDVTYFEWYGTEPNNLWGLESIIIGHRDYFSDIAQDPSVYPWSQPTTCFICEVELK